MKIEIGPSKDIQDPDQFTEEGWSNWIENGIYYKAPIVSPEKFGPHAYANGMWEQGIRNCICGCYMGSYNSSGPVDPFGMCPLNPK